MCSKPLCLVDPWCSEWGCCESDFDKEDFKEPPKKKAKGKGGKKVTGSKRFVSLTSMDKICKGLSEEHGKSYELGRLDCSSSGGRRGTERQVTMVKCVVTTCCSALSRYRSITGCRGLL